jgi:PKD repeat protein
VPGQTRRFHGDASDYAAGELEVAWDFGDATSINWLPAGDTTLTVSKVYAAPGRYTVTMSVRDAGGAVVSVESSIKVSLAQLQSDPADPQKRGLFIGGTADADDIRVRPVKDSGRFEVLLGGKSQGSFRPTGTLVIYGQAGDDVIDLAPAISIPSVIFGGAGDDQLRGGSHGNALSGGEGQDVLLGGGWRDLLIGGMGADRIDGAAGQDILIAGDSGSSKSLWDLIDIMGTWSRADAAVSVRVDGLRSSLLGDEYLADDGHADEVLRGAGGRDWAVLDGEPTPRPGRPQAGEIVTLA